MELPKNDDVKGKRQCFVQALHPVFCSEKAQQTLGEDLAAGYHAGSGQAHSATVSELKLSEESSPYLGTSLDADIEMYDKKRMQVCCAQVDESKKEADLLRGACSATCSDCGVCDICRQSPVGEDSQLDYVSANEQDFEDSNSSRELSEQGETAGIEALKPVDLVCDVLSGRAAKEHNNADMVEEGSASGCCGGYRVCTEAAVPELHQLLQGSLPAGSVTTCDHQSVLGGNRLEGHWSKERVYPNLLTCDHSESAEVRGAPLSDGTLSLQAAALSEQTDRRVHSGLVEQEGPSVPPRGRAPAVATQLCSSAGDSDFYSCEEPLVCTHGASCTYCTVKVVEGQCLVSTMLSGEEVAGKPSHGSTCSLSMELECRENLVNITSASKVNQAVDASSDFRACFTTSRSTSARLQLISRAVNTEITMMNKSRPAGWRRETFADAACNTDWPSGTGSAGGFGPQLADTLQKHSDGNIAAAERSSRVKEQWESKTESCSSDLRIDTERPMHLDKETLKNSASSYCPNLLQRAIEAELQVLNTHYQMCYQHCSKIYKLALEENACVRRYHENSFSETELGSSLLSVLEELKKNYNSMRTKIKMGIPLNALPPLSVEIKLFPISSSYVPCKLFREDLCYDSVSGMRKAAFEAPRLQEIKTSVSTEKPQPICLAAGGQPGDSASSEMFQEQREEQGVQHGCVKNEEGNESWFDAKEDFTVTDFSVIPEEMAKQQEKQEVADLREAQVTEGANQCSFICVGGLSPSVSEGDLRSHFQKYQISDILLCVDSADHRCAFVGFKDTGEAKLAVKEMNEIKIKGRPVSVEVVNNSSESRSSLFQILKKKPWHEVPSVDNSQRHARDKALAPASNSVEAPATTSAPEKVPLLPTASLKMPCSTQVSTETKCPGPKPSAEDTDTGENSLPKIPAAFSTNSFDTFISPNTMNLSSFTKLMKKLQETHPEASRDKIVDALLEVRKNNRGILSGLPISSIMERTSVILRKATPSCTGEKQCK